MTISWYSISISPQSGGGAIFNGYFSVDNNTNLVTAFYETINGSTNFNNNVLGPSDKPDRFANNLFINNSFSINGLNFTSISLQKYYLRNEPFFNLYSKYILWVVGRDLTRNITVTPISDPTTPISDPTTPISDPTTPISDPTTPISDPTIYVNNGFQLYNFLNSNREQCIITNDISVNFNLTSSNGIKTILSDNLIKITKI
jgi:hypothetical protein